MNIAAHFPAFAGIAHSAGFATLSRQGSPPGPVSARGGGRGSGKFQEAFPGRRAHDGCGNSEDALPGKNA